MTMVTQVLLDEVVAVRWSDERGAARLLLPS